MTFWDGLRSLTFSNEASVETDFILPLLSALGYERSDIRKNYPIVFQEGRRGRKHEADFVVFAEKPHNEHTSLLVIEAKSPSEKLLGSKAQAESYASNIRAPFLLLTNGVEIEIWQLQHTIKSELTLKAEVNELATRRGEVERLISKAATIEYCRSLQHKKIGAVIRDFGRYEDAEIHRTSKLAASVERTLSNSNSGERWTSTIIHNQFPEGALVLGASGFGKTTFARSMFRQAIATRHSTQKGRLPFDIPLPDLAISHHSAVGFMTARLAAHCPFVNEIILQQLLREEGASLVCDGFDRLRHWNEVTVDVAFVTKPSTESIRKHLQNVETLRAELGRKSRRPRIFGASEGIPDFSGRNPISGRSTGETSAFWFACSLIQEDLVRLFEDLGPWKRVS